MPEYISMTRNVKAWWYRKWIGIVWVGDRVSSPAWTGVGGEWTLPNEVIRLTVEAPRFLPHFSHSFLLSCICLSCMGSTVSLAEFPLRTVNDDCVADVQIARSIWELRARQSTPASSEPCNLNHSKTWPWTSITQGHSLLLCQNFVQWSETDPSFLTSSKWSKTRQNSSPRPL